MAMEGAGELLERPKTTCTQREVGLTGAAGRAGEGGQWEGPGMPEGRGILGVLSRPCKWQSTEKGCATLVT